MRARVLTSTRTVGTVFLHGAHVGAALFGVVIAFLGGGSLGLFLSFWAAGALGVVTWTVVGERRRRQAAAQVGSGIQPMSVRQPETLQDAPVVRRVRAAVRPRPVDEDEIRAQVLPVQALWPAGPPPASVPAATTPPPPVHQSTSTAASTLDEAPSPAPATTKRGRGKRAAQPRKPRGKAVATPQVSA